MTTYGIRIYADARDRVGCWLESFDPDEHEPGVPFPTGSVTVTTNPLRALRFVDKLDAFAFWQTQSSVTPLRPDGRANRPLTAFTVSIEPLEDTDGDQDDPEAQDDQGAEDQP